MRPSILVPGLCMLAAPVAGQSTISSYPLRARAPAQWTVLARPILEIGGESATGPTEFTKVVGVARLTSGTIVVADGTSRELRAFDSQGRFVKRYTRKGNGPGELPWLDAMTMVGDTMVVIDGRRAVHVFAPDGSWRTSLVLPAVPGYIVNPAIGALNGSDAVIKLRAGSLGSVRQDSVWLARISLRDTSVRIFGAQPLPPTFSARPGGPAPYALGFAPYTLAAVTPRRVCLAHSERYEISCLDSLGKTVVVIRRELAAMTVSDSARRAYRFVKSGRRPDGSSRYEGTLRAHRERVAAAARFAASYPAISQLLIAHSGELWVRRYVPEDGLSESPWRSNAVPSEWSIYDRQGRWIADCRLPARFAPGDIGRDYVLGVSQDDDDLERVIMLRLTADR